MSSRRFTSNPFGELQLSSVDRTKLLEIADALVQLKVEEYKQYIKTKKNIDMACWKRFSSAGPVTTFTERKSSSSAVNMISTLMVGPLVGTLDEVMFGLASPTLESMRVKASYLHDFSAAAILATIVEPTVEDPFRSVVVKWAELDIPGASIGFLQNRDYVFVESTGILHDSGGERIGYHLLHSVNFPQTLERQGRIRGNLALCGIFRQEGSDRTDCRGTSIINPRGDIIPSIAMARMVHATMAGIKYTYCGRMKKIVWLLDQKHGKRIELGAPLSLWDPVCVTCSKSIKSTRLRNISRMCNLCYGVLCRSCKVMKKLTFISPDLELTQSKLSFCVKCLVEANRLDTVEAARYQFVYGRPAYQSAQKSLGASFMSSLSGSLVLSKPRTSSA
ncbi:hypothetical protein CCR75_007414 [Bremia lactucae]|uniref:FYVE-type domain-containing protein n=1 Tax=Bremia lactucae TaxID=4779 RepID=A0A976ILB3_BRELC|nr:hypothetical protein CCR75_007414 [Bremia lactucae]